MQGVHITGGMLLSADVHFACRMNLINQFQVWVERLLGSWSFGGHVVFRLLFIVELCAVLL